MKTNIEKVFYNFRKEKPTSRSFLFIGLHNRCFGFSTLKNFTVEEYLKILLTNYLYNTNDNYNNLFSLGITK
ncbi:MAG: hypothetical protein LBL13_10660 [Bacteroidales bacterium]|jgi:hypothetical protein|nr:hypothetical protein [Bacteroidales bacterium]